MKTLIPSLLASVFLVGMTAAAAAPAATLVGKLADGSRVSLIAAAGGGYGIEIATAGTSKIVRPKPVRIEIFRNEADITSVDVSYSAVTKAAGATIASADVKEGNAILHVEDRYSLAGPVLNIARTIRVEGNAPGVGFQSGLMLTAPAAQFTSTSYFSPGALYGGPGQNNEGGTAGAKAFAAKAFQLREDALAAPLLGMNFADGSSVTLLNSVPDAGTTEEDTRARVSTVLIDERLRFGAFGSRNDASGGVEFGYWFPGGIVETGAANRTRRRYHPVRAGIEHKYTLALRFGTKEDLPVFTRNTWRWAYDVLKPRTNRLDLNLMRQVLFDHMANQVTTVDDRTGIAWIHQITSGLPWHRPDDMRASIGFVGKNLEVASLFLIEADRDTSPRGERLRKLALQIIGTFTSKLSMSPPTGEAIDLLTGEPTVSFPPSTWRGNPDAGARVFIRAPSEDLRKLVEAYAREKRQGRDHPEWLAWVRQFADWLVPQQRADGSFPRAWKRGTTEVIETSPSSSYSPVSLLAELSVAVGGADGARYRDSALKAAEYVWEAQGKQGVFTGATLDNPNVIDKEAGMLSLEAFLSAYDLTNDRKWVTRATVAADFTESWMYIWDVPMAVDAIDGELHWKKGVPTTGVNVISIGGKGGVDQYLDWSAPAYARLYQLTNDPHYLDVARILLFDTKAMLSMPGRTFDTAGPGWQQENFDLSTRRGFGGHRGWLPWVSVHHLWSMMGIEAIDPALLKQVAESGQGTSPK